MNLKMLMSSTAVLYVLTVIVQGFNFSSILSLIATLLFCSRKIGHFCKMSTLLVLEGVGIFMTTMFQLLFKSFNTKEFIVVLLLRLVFIGICYYDATVAAYIKKKCRKGEMDEY